MVRFLLKSATCSLAFFVSYRAKECFTINLFYHCKLLPRFALSFACLFALRALLSNLTSQRSVFIKRYLQGGIFVSYRAKEYSAINLFIIVNSYIGSRSFYYYRLKPFSEQILNALNQ